MRRSLILTVIAVLAGALSFATPATATAPVPPGQLAFLDSSRRGLLVVREGQAPSWVVSDFNPPSFGQESFLMDPSWSPDGRRIAFGRTDYAGLATIAGEVRIVSVADRATRVVVRLPLAGVPLHVTWSPDGRRLAFVLLTLTPASFVTWGLGNRSDVYVVDIDGTNLRPVMPAHPGLVGAPVWSPDSRRLAFSDDSQGVQAVYSVPVDAVGVPQRISPLGMAAESPRWSPDGRRIAFLTKAIASSSSRSDLWVAGADGQGAREVVAGIGDFPAWSPDSRRLAFGDDSGIVTVAVDGTRDLRRVTVGADQSPAWSRSGEIAFVRQWTERDGACGVYLVRPGGQPQRVYGSCGVGSDLAWSPV